MNSTNSSTFIEHNQNCNDIQNVAFNSSMLCLATSIIFVQSFIMYTFLSNRRLKNTPINNALFSLSTTDLMAAISIVFLVFRNLLQCQTSKTVIITISLSGYALSNICLLSTVGHLLVLSSERYICMEYALRYNEIVTKSRLRRCSFAIYSISVLITTLEILLFLTYQGFRNNRGYVYLGLTILLFCLIGFTAGQYSVIFYRTNQLIKSSNKLESYQRKKQQKALFIYFSMFAAFLLVCMPYYTLKILIVFKVTSTSLIQMIFMFLRFSISLINPLIYTLNKVDFRKECSNLLRRSFHYNDRRNQRKESINLVTFV